MPTLNITIDRSPKFNRFGMFLYIRKPSLTGRVYQAGLINKVTDRYVCLSIQTWLLNQWFLVDGCVDQ